MTTSTDKLTGLIAAKLQLVELLARLSRRQLELIDGGEMAGLIQLLAAKQTVLEQLQAADRKLDPFRQEDPERRLWRSAAERAACQSQAERADVLLAEAMELEQRAEVAMLRRRDAAALALDAANAAGDAHLAYVPQGAPPVSTLHVEG